MRWLIQKSQKSLVILDVILDVKHLVSLSLYKKAALQKACMTYDVFVQFVKKKIL